MLPGTGTVINMAAIVAGSALGVVLRGRLPQRAREVVTDGLGLVTLLIAAESAAAVFDRDFARAVGSSAPLLVVLGSVVLGGIVGSLLGIEHRLEGVGGALQRRFARADADSGARARFIEGFVNASLVFVIGPLAILGALSDGLGRGIEQLALKSALDGFASIAFAASFGWGVAAAALSVGVVQGAVTILGAALGGLLPAAHIAALTATGGLILVGVALRLLRLRSLPVADLLPALVVAPALSALVAALR